MGEGSVGEVELGGEGRGKENKSGGSVKGGGGVGYFGRR